MADWIRELETQLTQRERDLSGLDGDAQFALLKGKVKQILPEDKVLERFRESRKNGKPLVVKLGVDPTGTALHLGHSVPLFLLRRFQDLGHEVILIVGDFTAQIGDPAGRVDERPPLTREQIEQNFATYRDQAGKILDLDRVTIRYNSEWLDGVSLPDLIGTMKGINISASLQREDFRKRIEQGHSLTLAELLYSVLMGLDSVALECDIEIGGIDQLLNLQMCRTVMEIHGQIAEGIVCTDILEGVTGDGSKMSKSMGNAIALDDAPEEIYGKTMSIPDRLLESWFRLLTEIEDADCKRLMEGMGDGTFHPRDVKAMLARVLVAILHGGDAVAGAEAHFELIFRKKKTPDDMPEIAIGASDWSELSLIDVLDRGGVIATRSEGRRLAQQGAIRWCPADDEDADFVKLEEERLPDPPSDLVLKIGKRKFLKVVAS